MLSRPEFLKMAALVTGELLAGVTIPEIEEWEVSIDENQLKEAVTVGGLSRDLGRLNLIVHLDIEKAWRAVRLIAPNGLVYCTPDQGQTWESPWDRITFPS